MALANEQRAQGAGHGARSAIALASCAPWLVALVLGCGAPPGPAPAPPHPLLEPTEASAARALAYLSSTAEPVTVDVVVAMMVYAEVSGDALAASQAERRLRGVPDEAIAAFGPALGSMHPAYPSQALAERTLDPTDIPDPTMTLDDRDQTCPLEALVCERSPECDEYLELDLWGYPLTHQALTLVFYNWAGCVGDDEPRRQRIGARLRIAQRANPGPSDLASERLAMLGELGFAESIDDLWIEELLASQAESGAFYWEEGDEPHPHPTGVALWAIASWRRAE